MSMTYVLQGFAVLFMAAAALLMVFAGWTGRYSLVAVNLVLFVVNAGLFYWQGVIRSTLD